MSACEIEAVHIDYLLTAGIHWGHDPLCAPVSWVWPALTKEEALDASERGSPYSPDAPDIYRQRLHTLSVASAGRVGAMLLDQNRKSLNWRYDEEDWEKVYLFDPLPPQCVDPVAVLKAIRGYEYQSCEAPDWDWSEAAAFCNALILAAIPRLTGWDDAKTWIITDRWSLKP